MDDLFRHLRLVHFSVAAIAAFSLYLAIAAWNEGSALVTELDRFEGELVLLRRAPLDPQAISTVLPEWAAAPAERVRLQAQRRVGVRLTTPEQSQFFNVFRHRPDSMFPEGLPLFVYRQERDSMSWGAMVVDSLVAPWDSIRSWVETHAGSTGVPILQVSLELRDASPLQYPQAYGTIALTLRNPLLTRTDRDRQPFRLFLQRTPMWVSFDSAKVSGDWLQEAFPRIAVYWDSVAGRTMSEAREWALSMRSEELEKRQASILGFDIEGSHVAGVVPPVLAALLAYMLSLVRHIRVSVSTPNGHAALAKIPVPAWIGVMPNMVAAAATFLTLAVVPPVTVGILLWNQMRWSPEASALTGAAIAILGFCITHQAWSVATQLRQAALSKHGT